MKKILFLAFNYPNGFFGPSTNCTLRIMKALCESGRYEVHCVSYADRGEDAYEIIPNIVLHRLPMKAKMKKVPRWVKQLSFLLKLPLYPFDKPLLYFRLYHASLDLIRSDHFDLVVSQCYPDECAWVGTFLKKHGFVDKLMVIFWDNIYGKLPRRVIPKGFALHRQRWAEGIIAKYADRLVSLYPIKKFHGQYGELPEAVGKRAYLGIPSVIRPNVKPVSSKQDAIVNDKINILYSGTIFRESYVEYLVDLLNATPEAGNINLIFFQRGVSSEKWGSLKERFRGTMYVSGWIPLPDLLALYPKVNFFMSYPGNPTAICSKLFEYVSFGKPILVLYDDDSDVNISTFSTYPACHCVDVRAQVSKNAPMLSEYIRAKNDFSISFDEVEEMFMKDSPRAYVELIEKMLK